MTGGGRLVAAWRGFWFRDGSLTDLAVARVLVCAMALHLNAGGMRFQHVAAVPAALWAPAGVVETLGLPQPGAVQLAWLAGASRGALWAALLGFATPVAMLAAFLLQLLQEAYLNCFGKVTHGTIPLLWAMLFLALGPSGRALSLDALLGGWRRRGWAAIVPEQDRVPAARWPLELIFIELAAFYFQAGWAKLHTSGAAWADGYTLQYHLLDKGVPLGMWVAESIGACRALSTLVLVFELGFPLAIVLRRLRPLFLAGGVAFHLGTTHLMNVSFWPVWLLYAVFVPWSRLAAGLRGSLARVALRSGGRPA
jgi:hypothetical protein